MAALDPFLAQLDLCYFEVTEAFKGLADEHVWVRPAPNLLSIGELAGHIAYGEAVRFAGSSFNGGAEEDLSDCKISSPLLDQNFHYYPTTLASSPTPAQKALGAKDVLSELERIHKACVAYLIGKDPDLESKAPHWGSTYIELLKYLAFHIAYHTGQMYSVRHLLGETTPDN